MKCIYTSKKEEKKLVIHHALRNDGHFILKEETSESELFATEKEKRGKSEKTRNSGISISFGESSYTSNYFIYNLKATLKWPRPCAQKGWKFLC